MKSANATEVKNRFGRFLESAIVEPLIIRKTGRPVVVMLSLREYERLCALEDEYWGKTADQAAKEGFIGPEESMNFIRAKINEKN